MTYCTVYDGDIVSGGQTYRFIDQAFPATTSGNTAMRARAAAAAGVSAYVDGGDKAISVAGPILRGWFVNTSTNAGVESIDTASEADRHTALVKTTMRRKEADYDSLFAFHDNADRLVRGWQKKIAAYDERNAGNAASRPLILAAAAVDLNEIARYATAQGSVDSGGNWYPRFVYTGGDAAANANLWYVWPGIGSNPAGGVAVPAPHTTADFTTTPTAAQIEAADVYGYLRG